MRCSNPNANHENTKITKLTKKKFSCMSFVFFV